MTSIAGIAVRVGALVLAALVGFGLGLLVPDKAPSSAIEQDNQELRRIHDEDQSDRSPQDGRPVDWATVGPRDLARLARVKALFAENRLKTANDFYHAAMVLQHGVSPEDFLLAHDFCVVALTKGKNDEETRWLAASAEDRFLMNIGRPQRFATQFRSDGRGPMALWSVDATVTDELRLLMGGDSVAEAKAHEIELNKN